MCARARVRTHTHFLTRALTQAMSSICSQEFGGKHAFLNVYPHLSKVKTSDIVWAHGKVTPLRKLRIAFFIPHHNVSGGMKMLMEQVRHLRGRGHTVVAIYRENSSDSSAGIVMPSWTDVSADEEVLVRGNIGLAAAIPPDVDVIVAGYFTQVPELAHSNVPVFYWEQGNEHVFGNVNVDNEAWEETFKACMCAPITIAAVSPTVANILAVRFSRRTGLIPNGIDSSKFHADPTMSVGTRVLIVGHPLLPLKEHGVALCALNAVHARVPQLTVTWMCQVQPFVSNVSFPIQFIVQPPQSKIPDIYRKHDVLLYTSRCAHANLSDFSISNLLSMFHSAYLNACISDSSDCYLVSSVVVVMCFLVGMRDLGCRPWKRWPQGVSL